MEKSGGRHLQAFEEELKGGGSVQSTFLTDIDQLFHSALQVNEIEGIILNPWNRTIMLDKNLINIILKYMKLCKELSCSVK